MCFPLAPKFSASGHPKHAPYRVGSASFFVSTREEVGAGELPGCQPRSCKARGGVTAVLPSVALCEFCSSGAALLPAPPACNCKKAPGRAFVFASTLLQCSKFRRRVAQQSPANVPPAIYFPSSATSWARVVPLPGLCSLCFLQRNVLPALRVLLRLISSSRRLAGEARAAKDARMVPGEQAEDAIVADVANGKDGEVRAMGVGDDAEQQHDGKFTMQSLLWHGGSVWDAWFSCASNQVAQVLLTLPYSFSQLGMLSGVLLQIFYGLMGSWTAYLISVLYAEYRARKEKEGVSFKNHVIQWFEVLDGILGPYWKAAGLAFNCTFLLFGTVIQLIACASNIYYINDRLDKRTWTYIFGACCATTVFIPSFHNYRVWSFLGLGMTTYTAWYLTIAAAVHGQVDGVTHSGPNKLVPYFTGATNILYTFGGHAITVEIMHAMWKPRKFKYIYLLATLYVFTLTLPSAAAMYWAFGDQLLTHTNAFSLLPRTGWRDAAVILMLIHQFITFGFACTPLYFVWEKVVGMHETRSIFLRALVRLPIVVPVWFLAIIFPFFGPINSAVGALLVSFTVYIIPALAHMLTYRSASARLNAAEKPPSFLPSWSGMFVLNAFVVAWVLVVGFGLGGWASVTNFIKQIDTFGLFAKCYQCPTKAHAGSPLPAPPHH